MNALRSITLLGTVHWENGQCSANTLCGIFERLSPDVLFQEVPYFDFLRKREVALQHPARDFRIPVQPLPLEILAIAQYLQNHELRQIPVDPLGQTGNRNYQHDEVLDWVPRTSLDIQNLLYEIQKKEGEHGFPYVNSQDHCRELKKLDDAFLERLRTVQRPQLSEFYASWKDYNARREESMTQNIIEFSRNNSCDSAIFLFGATHKLGLIREIQKIKKNHSITIQWKLYH